VNVPIGVVGNVGKLKMTSAPSGIAFGFRPDTSQLFAADAAVFAAVIADPVAVTVIGPVDDDVTMVA
jgi:hypothetical protein